MVDEVSKLGELLKLPDLEEETKALINATMRKFIGDMNPLTPEQKEEVASLMSEWFNGAKEGGS